MYVGSDGGKILLQGSEWAAYVQAHVLVLHRTFQRISSAADSMSTRRREIGISSIVYAENTVLDTARYVSYLEPSPYFLFLFF